MKNSIPIAALLATLTAPAAFGNHVDFIEDGGFTLSGSDGTFSATQTGASGNILGSERNVTLTADLGAWTARLDAPAGSGAVGPGSRFIMVSAGSADSIGSLSLLYNGIGNAGLGGLDFDTNWNFIGVDLGPVSGGTLDLRLRVGDLDGSIAEAFFGPVDLAGSYFFSFDDPNFVNAGVDFGSVDSVEVLFEATNQGVSYSVGNITREAIPEPSAVMLSGVGALGLLSRRRRA